jgi:hypothetical protein
MNPHRGPATGRFMPKPASQAVPLLVRDTRDPAAVSLGSKGGRATADRQRARVLAMMDRLRAEMGMADAR